MLLPLQGTGGPSSDYPTLEKTILHDAACAVSALFADEPWHIPLLPGQMERIVVSYMNDSNKMGLNAAQIIVKYRCDDKLNFRPQPPCRAEADEGLFSYRTKYLLQPRTDQRISTWLMLSETKPRSPYQSRFYRRRRSNVPNDVVSL